MILILFSLSLAYNIHIDDCYAILDQYKYDLTKFIDKDPYYSTSNLYTYIIRLCPSTTGGDKEDVFMMQCPKSFIGSCRDIITQNSLNYKPRNPKNFSEGVIYYAESEPFTDDGKTYKTLDLEFDLICDPLSTGDKIDFTYKYDDETSIGQISLRGRTSAACPTIVPTPTPTPVYEPDCKYTDRKDDDTDIGIDGDLKKLNDGPYGIKTIITIDGQNKSLFFQPCERMLCPPTFTCTTTNYSSAWLCDETSTDRQCISYGVGVSDIDLRPVDTSLANGMIYRMNDTTTNKSIDLTLTCSSTFPEGHILWSNLGVLIDNNLQIGGKTQEFCMRVIPTPDPHPEDGACVFNKTIGNQAISVDLERYNLGDVGWNARVTVESDGYHPDSTLIYQPCGAVICPADTYCDGDEDAQVWLCYEGSDGKECTGYGLTKYNLSISLADQSSLQNGLSVSYTGDNRRFADVTVYCDPYSTGDTITLPSYVTLIGRRLSFFVSMGGACPFSLPPTPSPTPAPGPMPTSTPVPKPWHPKKPSKPLEPTPTPRPTVAPEYAAYNDTHYVLLSFDGLKQQLFEGEVLVTHNRAPYSLFAGWHPWVLSDCPSEYVCDEAFDAANLWFCWTEEGGERVCHPAADKRIGLGMRLTEEGVDEATNGVVFDYEGAYGFATKLVVKCNVFETESLKFDDGAEFNYYEDGNGRLTIILDSSATCPNELAKPTIPPTPNPTPTVNPNSKVDRHFKSENINDQVIDLDLAKLPSISQTVMVKSDNKVYRSFIVFNPSVVGPCPDGYSCVTSEKSSMWSCFNSTSKNNVCVPIGDDRYGIQFDTIESKRSSSSATLPDGVAVKYTGGYDLIESTVNFVCNQYLPASDGLAFQITATKSGKSFCFTIQTDAVCPIDEKDRGGISGGAIFLIVVIGGAALYLCVGTLVVYIRNGAIAVPNADFWSEFVECVATAVIFIFSCGKKGGMAKYDAI